MAEQETLDAVERGPEPPGYMKREEYEATEDGVRLTAQAALYEALAAAQGAFPAIPRDRTVRVQTKTGGAYTFSYAPLDTILDKVRPSLAANGLAITQTFSGGAMVTTLLHADGGTIESAFPLERGNLGWQEFGSAITYARRYALVALLGIATEEDDDGNAAAGNTATAQGRAAGASERPAQVTRASRGSSASEAQVKMVNGLIREMIERGIGDDETLRASVHTQYGVEHIPELTGGRDGQASELIGRLQKALCNSYLDEFSTEEAEAFVLEHGGTDGLLANVPANQLSDLLKALKAAAA